MSLEREVNAEIGLALERVEVAAGAEHPLAAEPGHERMAYVIAGTGRAIVDAAEHPIDAESVVWLEPGERCTLVAGDAGLAVLTATAPR